MAIGNAGSARYWVGLRRGILRCSVIAACAAVTGPAAAKDRVVVGVPLTGPFKSIDEMCDAVRCATVDVDGAEVQQVRRCSASLPLGSPTYRDAAPPIEEVQLRQMDCHTPGLHDNGWETYYLVVQAGGEWWRSEPLVTAGGYGKSCTATLHAKCEARDLVPAGRTETIVRVSVGSDCAWCERTGARLVEADLLFGLGMADARPILWGPIWVGQRVETVLAPASEGDRSACVPSKSSVTLTPRWLPGGRLEVTGPNTWFAPHTPLKSDARGELFSTARRVPRPTGVHRFIAPRGR